MYIYIYMIFILLEVTLGLFEHTHWTTKTLSHHHFPYHTPFYKQYISYSTGKKHGGENNYLTNGLLLYLSFLDGISLQYWNISSTILLSNCMAKFVPAFSRTLTSKMKLIISSAILIVYLHWYDSWVLVAQLPFTIYRFIKPFGRINYSNISNLTHWILSSAVVDITYYL